MIPWQKDVYIAMMIKAVEEENLKKQLAESAARASGKKPNRPKRRRQ